MKVQQGNNAHPGAGGAERERGEAELPCGWTGRASHAQPLM